MGFFNGAYEAYVNGNINNEYQAEAEALRLMNKEQSKMRCTCGKCDISFASISDYQKHICGMENKMTREEAAKKACVGEYGNTIVTALHNLGLLKFDEPKEVVRLCSYEDNKLGMVKVELWPEGLVLWVGGEIVWKSWVNSVPDLIIIEARKYIDDCRTKPYESSQAFKIISDHFKMLEKLLEYVEKRKGA